MMGRGCRATYLRRHENQTGNPDYARQPDRGRGENIGDAEDAMKGLSLAL